MWGHRCKVAEQGEESAWLRKTSLLLQTNQRCIEPRALQPNFLVVWVFLRLERERKLGLTVLQVRHVSHLQLFPSHARCCPTRRCAEPYQEKPHVATQEGHGDINEV